MDEGSGDKEPPSSDQQTAARMLLLLVKRGEWLNRASLGLWILKLMFRTLLPEDCEDDFVRIAAISHERSLPCALPLAGKTPQTSADKSAGSLKGGGEEPRQREPLAQALAQSKITQYTKIFTVSEKYRMVFLLDMSSSLALIDPDSEQVLVNELLAALSNVLAGIVVPFNAGDNRDCQIYPEIHLTVIAEMDHPESPAETSAGLYRQARRPLTQSFGVRHDNVASVTAKLKNALYKAYQKAMKQRPANILTSVQVDSMLSHDVGTPKTQHRTVERCSSDMLELLRAGEYALTLLPPEGISSLVMFTDGVQSHPPSSAKDAEHILSRLAGVGIACSVVQIGSPHGFTPKCSFGFVPDNGLLRHIAVATSGIFLYASDCKPVGNSTSCDPQAINFYHKNFLLRGFHVNTPQYEKCFTAVNGGRERPVDLLRERTLEVRHDHCAPLNNSLEDFSSISFPWSPTSQPPFAKQVLMRYREYYLEADIYRLISARLRQGFGIQAVHSTGDGARNPGKSYVYLSMFYHPDVMIQYRVKKMSLRQGIGGPVNVPSQQKSLRVELNVLAVTGFAMYCINLERALKHPQQQNHPLYGKACALRSYMDDIFAADELLKFLSHPMVQPSRIRGQVLQGQSPAPEKSTNVSQVSGSLEDLRNGFQHVFRPKFWPMATAWFDCDYMNVMLRPPRLEPRRRRARPDFSSKPVSLVEQLRRQIGQLWSTFSVTGGVHVAYVRVPQLDRNFREYSGFSVVQVADVTNRWCLIKILHFDLSFAERKAVLSQIASIISEAREPAKVGYLSNEIVACKRPVHILLPQGARAVAHLLHEDSSIGQPRLSMPGFHDADRHFPLDLLRGFSTEWVSDCFSPSPTPTDDMPTGNLSSADVAYRLIHTARLDEGFLVVDESPEDVLFYKEVPLRQIERDGKQSVDLALLYFLARTFLPGDQGRIITQISSEPADDPQLVDQFAEIRRRLRVADEMIVSQVATFDCLRQYIHQRYANPSLVVSRLREIDETHVVRRMSSAIKTRNLVPGSKFMIAICDHPFPGQRRVKEDADIQMEASHTVQHAFLPQAIIQESDDLEQHVLLYVSRTQLPLSDAADVLWQYHLEKALVDFSDGEYVTYMTAPSSSVARDPIFRSLEELVVADAPQLSGTAFPNDFDTCRSFFKDLKASLLMISTPSLKSYVGRNRNPGNFSSTSVVLFELSRPELEARTRSSPAIEANEFGWLGSTSIVKESITGFRRAAAAPSELAGDGAQRAGRKMPADYFVGSIGSPVTVNSAGITQFTNAFLPAMDHIFTEAYIRSTYSSALLGIGMPRSSLRRALSACAESSFEMDITAFLNARHLAILRKEFGDLTSDDEDVQNRFFREIQTHFLPVRVHDDEGEDEGTYCFLPASVKPLIRPPGPTDQCDSQAIVSSILRLQSEPMFVRLECTYGRGDTFVRTKVGCLPLSYTGDVGGSHRNFTPSRIGCRGSPLESADGTRAVMHIVCLTLSPLMGSPREGPWRPAGPWAGESCQDEEHIGDSSLAQTGMPSPGESERGFHAPLSPTEAIAEVEARLEGLLKYQALHYLLGVKPVTKALLRFIYGQLSSRSPFSHAARAQDIPLHLVRTHGRKLFLEELRRVDLGHLDLRHAGPYFYVSEKRDPASPPANEKSGPARGNGGDNAPPSSKPCRLQRFWFLLLPAPPVVRTCFFSKVIHAEEATAIIDHVARAVNRTVERVNRIILLRELNEKRICSAYLVTPDEAETSDANETLDDTSELESSDNALEVLHVRHPRKPSMRVSAKKFAPGQFACPLVFHKSCPLHWRLKPNQALNSIASTVMHPFFVGNRKNLFVIAKCQSVFYVKLYESGPGMLNNPAESDATEHASRRDSADRDEMRDEMRELSSTPAAGRAMSTPSVGPYDAQPVFIPTQTNPTPKKYLACIPTPKCSAECRELVMEVYGVDPVDKEITEDLVALLESRLTTNVTLSVISAFLARHVSLKLTMTDLAYILPVSHKPSKSMSCVLPSEVQQPLNYLLYVKQALLQYLSPLAGPNVVTLLQQYYQLERTTSGYNHGRHQSGNHDLCLGNLSFLYNSTPTRTPTTTEAAVGQGIASVCISVFDRNGNIVFDLPSLSQGYRPYDSFRDVAKRFAQSWAVGGNAQERLKNVNGSSELLLQTDIWTVGSASADVLMDKVRATMQAALCDYFIEVVALPRIRYQAIAIEEGSVMNQEDVDEFARQAEAAFEIFEQSSDWTNPAINSLKLSLRYEPRALVTAAEEIIDVLRDCGDHFRPICLQARCSDPTHADHLDANSDWLRLQFSEEEIDKDNSTGVSEPCAFLIIGGVQEPRCIYQPPLLAMSSAIDRRLSIDSDWSHSRRSSVETQASDRSAARMNHSRKGSWSAMKAVNPLEDFAFYTPFVADGTGAKREIARGCFTILQIDRSSLQIFFYNWKAANCENFSHCVQRVLNWHTGRRHVLDNIFCQKLGMFYHAHSISSALASATSVTVQRPVSTGSQSGIASPNAPGDLQALPALLYNRRSQSKASAQQNLLTPQQVPDWAKMASLDINQALRIWEPKADAPIIGHASVGDHLVLHGSRFMDAYQRHAQHAREQQDALSVYTKWSKRHQSDTDADDRISANDLAVLLRTSRLIHFCRTPQFFTHFRHSPGGMDASTSGPGTIAVPDKREASWYMALADTILREYIRYLQALDMKLIVFGIEHDGNETPHSGMITSRITISDGLSAEVPVVFVQRAFEGGLLMCEIRIQGSFVCVNLYTVNRRYGRLHVASPGFQSAEASRQNFKLFAQDSARFKNMIHVNSFVYDFHIRHFALILEQMPAVPASLKLLDFMRSFVAHNARPAKYSRNRICQGSFTINTASMPKEVFQYITKSPGLYGLRSVFEGSKAVGCYVSTDFPDFSQTEPSDESAFQYTLVTYPAEDAQATVRLTYFVLVVNRREMFPRRPDVKKALVPDLLEVLNTSPRTGFAEHDLLGEQISTGCTLGDVMCFAERRLDSMVQQAVRFYNRDNLWRRLRDCTEDLSDDDLAVLISRFNGRSLVDFDSSLAHVFDLAIPWKDVIQSLCVAYAGSARRLVTESGTTYAILLNPRRDDSLVELVHCPDSHICAYLLTREGRSAYDLIDANHVSDVIRAILFHVWRRDLPQ